MAPLTDGGRVDGLPIPTKSDTEFFPRVTYHGKRSDWVCRMEVRSHPDDTEVSSHLFDGVWAAWPDISSVYDITVWYFTAQKFTGHAEGMKVKITFELGKRETVFRKESFITEVIPG